MPAERVADGVTERSNVQSGDRCALHAGRGEACGIAFRRHPDRHVRPRLHLLRSQEFGGQPDRLRGVFGADARFCGSHRCIDQFAHREPAGRRYCVEGARHATLEGVDREGRKVPGVDPLQRIGWFTRRDEATTACCTRWPIGEAVGVVVGTDDQAGTQDRGVPGAVGLACRILA